MKKHKMLIELVAKKETPNGIGILESVGIMNEIGKVAKKNKFDCYMKGYPASKLDYIPTGKKYNIKTVEDIAKLTPEQFEFFIDDLREWSKMVREIEALNNLGIGISAGNKNKGMIWLDTGLNEKKVSIEIEGTNKF